jgi:hypothetical protein
VQYVEANAVPLPILARVTAESAIGDERQRVHVSERGREPRDRQRVQDRKRATDVVTVIVAQHHAVEPAHADCAQVWRNDPVAAVSAGAESRPRVVQQRMARSLQEN